MSMTSSISRARPTTGSSFPSRASAVRFLPSCVSNGKLRGSSCQRLDITEGCGDGATGRTGGSASTEGASSLSIRSRIEGAGFSVADFGGGGGTVATRGAKGRGGAPTGRPDEERGTCGGSSRCNNSRRGIRPDVKKDSALLRRAVRSIPVLNNRSCPVQRMRVMAMSACRQSASGEPQFEAISFVFARSSRTSGSGSAGTVASSSSSRSSLTLFSCNNSAARFSTTNIASSTCAVVIFCFDSAAMSSASVITCAKSVLSTMGRVVVATDRLLNFLATGRHSAATPRKISQLRMTFSMANFWVLVEINGRPVRWCAAQAQHVCER